MASKSPVERIDRLEQVVHVIAEDQLSMQKRVERNHVMVQKQIAELASATRRGFDQVAAQFAETDKRMREGDARAQKRSMETDARIDKLVVAIGKFIAQQG
jgi:hypothetical protein